MNKLYIEVESDHPLDPVKSFEELDQLTTGIGDGSIRVTTITKTPSEMVQYADPD